MRHMKRWAFAAVGVAVAVACTKAPASPDPPTVGQTQPELQSTPGEAVPATPPPPPPN